MVIQNSEVSMTSKTSVASGTKLTIQSEMKPVVNLEGVQVLGGDEDFLSSLNYAKSSNGTVKEVGDTNPLLKSSTNRNIRLHTMEYLFRMLLRGIFGDEYDFEELFEETLGSNSVDTEGLFLKTTNISYSYWEEASVEYSSTGTVVTGDGRELEFNYSFALSERFVEEYNVQDMRLQNCIDPLVINLDDCPTQIANQTFFFDLDADGELDEISNIEKGSGFLALDRNEDGEINDGFELFGVRTGDGFRELAEFDEDGNGWIDENDPIFKKLRIMTVNERGEHELYGLKESDVGAICLAKLGTNLVRRDDEGNMKAALRQSGVFLHEKDGHAGGVQHVDFVK